MIRFDTTATFQAEFTTDSTLVAAAFGPSESFVAGFEDVSEVPVADYYDGEYEITPGDEDATVQASGLVMRKNLVVKAVPQNYGRILWDGSSIKVY